MRATGIWIQNLNGFRKNQFFTCINYFNLAYSITFNIPFLLLFSIIFNMLWENALWTVFKVFITSFWTHFYIPWCTAHPATILWKTGWKSSSHLGHAVLRVESERVMAGQKLSGPLNFCLHSYFHSMSQVGADLPTCKPERRRYMKQSYSWSTASSSMSEK